MSNQVMSIQEEEQFKIRLLEKEIKDLKSDNIKLKVDNEEYRQENNELKKTCKALTKETITTADKIQIEKDIMSLGSWGLGINHDFLKKKLIEGIELGLEKAKKENWKTVEPLIRCLA